MKKKALIRIGLMAGIMVLGIVMAFYVKHWLLKIPFIIIAFVLAVVLIRLFVAYKRKKLYFNGKIVTIMPPKRKIGRYTIIIKDGKISKKFYMIQKPQMKIGSTYVVVYEDKSFTILEYQEAKFQAMNMKGLNKNPKYRM